MIWNSEGLAVPGRQLVKRFQEASSRRLLERSGTACVSRSYMQPATKQTAKTEMAYPTSGERATRHSRR